MSVAASGRSDSPVPPARRWFVLAVGMIAMTAACSFQFGLAYLIPALRTQGLSLNQAGLLAAAPTAGLCTTLIVWGAAADRWGERVVMTTGLALAGVILLLASRADQPITMGCFFFLAGAAGAAVHASSGRLIMGWFAARERGLAMGLRQTAQPAGVAVAALALPVLASTAVAPAVVLLASLSLGSAVLIAVFARDPQRGSSVPEQVSASPYRTPVLWRIHAASALLIVPQFTVSTFSLVFLVEAHHFNPATAGKVLACAQIAGACTRLLAGWWSDRVASRLRPMRTVAWTISAVTVLLFLTSQSPAAVVALVIAAAMTVAPNGLAFTAVAEHAGRAWSGRALGIQNTAQNAVAFATPPVLGTLIGAVGYGPAFLAILPLPLLAAVVIPVPRERSSADSPAAPHRPTPRQPPRPDLPARRLHR